MAKKNVLALPPTIAARVRAALGPSRDLPLVTEIPRLLVVLAMVLVPLPFFLRRAA